MKNMILSIVLTLLAVTCPTTQATDFYQGIDVSSYQGEINFEELASSGCTYLYIKAGEGENTVDSRFEENYKGAENLHFGFYYYVTAQNTEEAESQAEQFSKLIQGIDYSLRPVMDYESFSQVSVAESNAIALSFLEKLEALTGVKPAIYTDEYNVKTRWSTALSDYPLWVADYAHLAKPEEYILPENSVWTEWSGYQYTDSAVVSGIKGDVDGDLFTSGLMISKTEENSSEDPKEDGSSTPLSYTVKKGDTLWEISKKFQTTVAILAEMNEITNVNLIYVGEVLEIPTKGSYTVKSGDTLTEIALKFNTTVNLFAEINDISDINLIYVGEVLFLPS
ncbi:MAG: GH25 family lysozyme [Eubacteriales bacterium]